MQSAGTVVLLIIFVISGGAVSHPIIRRFVREHAQLQFTAMFMATVGAIYLVVGIFVDVNGLIRWMWQRVVIGHYIDRNYSISECDQTLTINCIKYGGVYGDAMAISKINECTQLKLLPSSMPSLKWTSLWITDTYSYAPGGGGPGGGLLDEVLKVGGWGDWYFSLIKFELPTKGTDLEFAGVLLFVQSDEHEPTSLYIDRVIEPWKWNLTQHIWWRDRPGSFQMVTDALPAPQKSHWYVIEITKLYNQWSAGIAGNFGFQIRPSTNYGSIIRFASNLAPDKTKIPCVLLCEKLRP